jgi:hypothetical protein
LRLDFIILFSLHKKILRGFIHRGHNYSLTKYRLRPCSLARHPLDKWFYISHSSLVPVTCITGLKSNLSYIQQFMSQCQLCTPIISNPIYPVKGYMPFF